MNSLENSSSVAGLFGAFLVREDLGPLLRYEEEFSKLTLADLTRVAQHYFLDDTLSVAILCDKKEI